MSKYTLKLELEREDGFVTLYRKIELNDSYEAGLKRSKSLARKWLDNFLGVL